MKQIELPGLLETVQVYLSAARNSDGDARVLYTARARNAVTVATEEMRVLLLNLEMVEASLPQEAPKNG